jgi:FkbM family methyltransferase
VIAFEPTDTAYGKLLGNLALNPLLSRRVDPVQAFLTADPEDAKPAGIPSFWPLAGSVSGERLHPVHGGAYQPLEGARSLRLDDWIRDRGCDRIDFLKIDVDGFEPDVLEGAGDVLRAFGPTLLMEFSPHVIEERGRSFGDLTGMLRDLGYGCRSLSGRPLPLDDSIVRLIPGGGSINVILFRPK